MLLIFTKIVNNSRTWLRLVPSVRVITRHIALKIQNLQMKHIKSLNKTLCHLARSTYTSTHVRPCSSPLPRHTCKQQQYILIFKQKYAFTIKIEHVFCIQFSTLRPLRPCSGVCIWIYASQKRFVIYITFIINFLP